MDLEADINFGNLPSAGYAIIAVGFYYVFLCLLEQILGVAVGAMAAA